MRVALSPATVREILSRLGIAGSGPYLSLSAILIAGMTVQTWGQRWSGDYWLHRAAVLELSLDPWTPAHPLTPSTAPDPSLSPYTLLLGLIVRVTGAGVGDVLSVAALFNLVLVLVAFNGFVRRFSLAPLAPFCCLLATLFLWGMGPWLWSGYLNANSIGFGLPYPSMFAFALALFGLALLYDVFDGAGLRRLGLATVLGALVVLTHPFTGVLMFLAAVAVTGARLPSISARRAVAFAAAAVVAAALVLLWPYYPVLEVLISGSEYDQAHGRLYRRVFARTFLVIPGLIALASRLRSDRRDPLALTFLLAAAAFAIGWVTDRDSLGRALPLAMLAAHVAFGVWLAGPGVARWRSAPSAQRAAAILCGSVLLMTGVFGSRAGLARAVPSTLLPAAVADDIRLKPLDEDLAFLEAKTSRDDVLLASALQPATVSPGLGAKVVAPGYIVPLLDDVDQRRADVARFFSTASPHERQRIIERYGVSVVLFDGTSGEDAEALGPIIYRDGRYVLVDVER